MYIKIKFDEKSDAGKYFIQCAQTRQISLAGLLEHLLDTISKNDMVLAVLDDNNKPSDRPKGKHRKLRKSISEIGKPTPKQGTASLSDT